MINKLKIVKITKCVLSALWWAALVLLAMLLVNIIGAKMRGEVPRVFGYSIMNIVSGSMEEKIPAGSYILIESVDPADVKVDDIICFYSDDPSIKGYPNTHRVVADPIVNSDGSFEFVTRGDANLKNDDYTAKGDRLIGRYVRTLDGFGSFVSWLTGKGMIFVMIALFALTVGMSAYTVVVKAKADSGESVGKDEDSDSNEFQDK
ncbi:MAG: signal peptidase I [Clostridia bacterium]|nr:signal peptidase I [Clostridia bacterium]